MKKFPLWVGLFWAFTNLSAQELNIENTYQFETLRKNCYLGEVYVDEENQDLVLQYVQKKPTSTVFYSYHFDDQLNFKEQYQDEYNLSSATASLGEELKAAGQDIKTAFQWFTNKYKGETYTTERIHIDVAFGGKIVARKYKYTYAYQWDFGRYYPRTELIDKMDIKGAKMEKIYLYDWFQNNATGDAYLIVGVKAPKGSKIKYQQARKFQIIRVSKDFELEYLESFTFKYNMAISYAGILSNQPPEEYDEFDADIPLAQDISQGTLALVFSPVKALLGKKNQGDQPEKQKLVLIKPDGSIQSKISFTAKVSGWVIEDFILSPDGKDAYFYGPAKENAYVNQVMPTNSPLTGRDEIKDIKWKSFQMMKISNGELAWVSDTDLKEFKEKAIAPPSQKQMPIYKGQKFAKLLTYLSPQGEIFIGGQNYTTKKIQEGDRTRKVIDNYKDLVLFHFNDKGKLKSQYGVRRDKMNRHSKAFPTPQELILSKDESTLVWIYGEIKGFRGGTDLFNIGNAGVGTISKSKLLYYPAVSKIDLTGGTVGDFVMLGQDAEGKQLYYTHPNFSYVLSPNSNNLTFIGEDRKGTTIWMGKMEL